MRRGSQLKGDAAMDGKKKKTIGIVVVVLIVGLGIGLAYRLLNAPATVALPEGVYGFVDIANEGYYVNKNGQSYGGSGLLENAAVGAEKQYYTREEKAARLPDLVGVFMDDGQLGKGCNKGYIYKEDYLDFLYFTEEDRESWPEHQDGVDDFIYYTAYDSDGVTELGVFKRINVKIDKSCYLSDGSIYVVMEDYSYWAPGIDELWNDDEIEVFAADTGQDADELRAERDRLWEEYNAQQVTYSTEELPEDVQEELNQLGDGAQAGN